MNFSLGAYYTAHFIFAVQYFQTSLILPKLYTKVKIEWLLENAQNNAEHGYALNPIAEELENN